MTSTVKRVLTTVIGLPLIFTLVFFLPQYNHLALFVFIILMIAGGTYEMYTMLKKKSSPSPLMFLAPVFPIIQFFSGVENTEFSFYVFIFISMLVLAVEVFRGAKDNFDSALNQGAYTLLGLFYPGLLSIFFVDILFLENATAYILFFLVLVFGSDTFAYLIGMAFGKNNSGFVKVSPKKSIAGFLGGLLFPALFGILAPVLFPSVFLFSKVQGLFIGLATAIFAEIGDLIESAIKRSAGVKDSGFIIPGRGGILDSIDSILVATVPFIILVNLFIL